MRSFSVSELTQEITSIFREVFPGSILVEGEISNFKCSYKGHWYFTLKDDQTQISVVMFKGSSGKLDFTPKDGDLVQIQGTLSFFKERGQCQIICQDINKQGIGSILAILEKRKKKLQEEGLFDETHKNPMPLLPFRVGVLTSRQGAVLHDICRTLKSFDLTPEVFLFHTAVQGEHAANEIRKQLIKASQSKHDLDIILIARGGGSTEDLLPYSDEALLREIHRSEIPVISAVGHEVDNPLCDFVADFRAPTPTAGASLIGKQLTTTKGAILSKKDELTQEVENLFSETKRKLDTNVLENLSNELNYKILDHRRHVFYMNDMMDKEIKNVLKAKKEMLHHFKLFYHETSPRTILKKGYALVYQHKDTRLLTNAAMLQTKDLIDITFHDGKRTAEIKSEEKL